MHFPHQTKVESAPFAGSSISMDVVRGTRKKLKTKEEKNFIYDYLMQCLSCRFVAQRQNASTADANVN